MTKEDTVRRFPLSVLPSDRLAVIQVLWPKTTPLPWFCLMLDNLKLFQIYQTCWDGGRKPKDVAEE